MSDEEEFVVARAYGDGTNAMSGLESWRLSVLHRSSTNCGSSNGLSLGDMPFSTIAAKAKATKMVDGVDVDGVLWEERCVCEGKKRKESRK